MMEFKIYFLFLFSLCFCKLESVLFKHRKIQSGSSISPHLDDSASKLSEGRRSNTALFLEEIKQEVDSLDHREGTPSRSYSAYKRRSPDSHLLSDFDPGTDFARRGGGYSLKSCKIEEDASLDAGDTTFALFASLLDSALQGSYMKIYC